MEALCLVIFITRLNRSSSGKDAEKRNSFTQQSQHSRRHEIKIVRKLTKVKLVIHRLLPVAIKMNTTVDCASHEGVLESGIVTSPFLISTLCGGG
jgi:hypothetical protein